MSKPINKNPWSNKTLTIRLAGERARRLSAVAKSMEVGTTPYHALDRCIEIAEADISGIGRHSEELIEISDQLNQLSGSMADISRHAIHGTDTHDSMDRKLDEMRKFLALLADSAASESDGNEPMPISDWLNRIAAEEPNLKYLLARATWQGLERRGETKADLDVLVERVATKQDEPGARIKIPPCVVRIGRVLAPLEAHSKILFKDFYIACQRNEASFWLLTIREIGPQGSLGPTTLFTSEQ
ncbi:hypothetical protein [Acidovorax soli]|uniref:Uncharacterized protein n=1 Tax=Acidovorax soli TaxID=592050 RepID=A0A1H4B6M8_9BURK|nr:hypothetical protein [Acidovorax soli]SEA43608.1 hypothetical protein SAMN05421875_1135 [Acidovorax soli]